VKQQITFYVLGTLLIDSYKEGSVVTSVVDKLVDIYFRFLRNFIHQKLLSADSWILTGIGPIGGRFFWGGAKKTRFKLAQPQRFSRSICDELLDNEPVLNTTTVM